MSEWRVNSLAFWKGKGSLEEDKKKLSNKNMLENEEKLQGGTLKSTVRGS